MSTPHPVRGQGRASRPALPFCLGLARRSPSVLAARRPAPPPCRLPRPGEARRRGSRGPARRRRPASLHAPSPSGVRHLHVSAGHLHRLLEHFQAHGTRKAAEGVTLQRRPRQLRGSLARFLLRRRHLAAEERRVERERATGRRGRGGTAVV